ncbi:MAG: metallophosphoesterase [Lentimicrobiaceae bacterium]|nr:metallophosphoesterase [Lentimicrobiaceae bacterium]
MNFIIMLLTMLAAILGANFYVFFRLWHLIPLFTGSRIVLVCIAVFLCSSPLMAMGLGNRFPVSVTSLLYQVGTSWLIILLYLVIIFFVLDIIRLTGVLPLKPFMFNSWSGFGILTLLLVALLTTGNYNYHHKKRVALAIKTEKKISSERSLKIVALSDLHLGYGIDTKEFRKWVHLINKENPDVVLIAGDAVDNSVRPLRERGFTDVFGEIKTKYGIYMVPGNHEYISNIDQSIDFLTRAGVTLLRDSVALINDSFYIIGRDDRSNFKRKTIAEMTASLDESKPTILIDHQPYHLDEVAKYPVDLYLAGHTHNGQTWPVSLITKVMYEISYGYLKKGNTHFYVTSGIGIWGGKFRMGSRSEYVVITIQ